MQWLRIYKLILGEVGKDGIVITNLDSNGNYQADSLKIAFEIEKDTTKKCNKSRVQIWNLSDASLQKVEKDDLYVELWAGYYGENNLKKIYQGHSYKVTSKDDNDGKDIVTEIKCQDGYKAIRDSLLSISYPPGVSTQTVLNTIVSNMGMTLSAASDVTYPSYPGGYSFVGKCRDALTEVCGTIGAKWSIQNGVVQVIMSGGSTNVQGMVFSATTGLIGHPEHINRSALNTCDDSTDDDACVTRRKKRTEQKKDRLQQKTGWKITTLLCPSVTPGDLVKIDSVRVTGWFRVDSLRHMGNSREGNWHTEMHCIDPGVKTTTS